MHGNLSTRLEKLFTQAIQAAFGELVPAEIGRAPKRSSATISAIALLNSLSSSA